MQVRMAQMSVDADGAQAEALAEVDGERRGDRRCTVARAASADQQPHRMIDDRERRELFRETSNRLGARNPSGRVFENRQRNQLPGTLRYAAIGMGGIVQRQSRLRSLL